MSTVTLDPASDGTIDTSVWQKWSFPGGQVFTGTYSGNVNKGVRQPTAPSTTGLYDHCEPPDTGTYDMGIIMQAMGVSGTVSQIDIWSYLQSDGNDDLQVSYSFASNSGAFISVGINGGWAQTTYTGLAIPFVSLDAPTITCRCDNVKNDQTALYALYVIMTYTLGGVFPPGTAAGIFNIGAPDWINGLTTLLPGSFKTRHKPAYAMSKSGLYLPNKNIAL